MILEVRGVGEGVVDVLIKVREDVSEDWLCPHQENDAQKDERREKAHLAWESIVENWRERNMGKLVWSDGGDKRE